MPLFWNETKTAGLFEAILENYGVFQVVDMSAGVNLALASLRLSLKYAGLGMSPDHSNWQLAAEQHRQSGDPADCRCETLPLPAEPCHPADQVFPRAGQPQGRGGAAGRKPSHSGVSRCFPGGRGRSCGRLRFSSGLGKRAVKTINFIQDFKKLPVSGVASACPPLVS